MSDVERKKQIFALASELQRRCMAGVETADAIRQSALVRIADLRITWAQEDAKS